MLRFTDGTRIVRAVPEDLPALIRLVRIVNIGDGKDVLTRNFWVAKTPRGKVIGCCGVAWHGRTVGILTHLAVLPKYRRQGFGMTLFRMALRDVDLRRKRVAAFCTMYYHFRRFKREGFKVRRRADLPNDVRGFYQFTAKRYLKCAVMTMDL